MDIFFNSRDKPLLYNLLDWNLSRRKLFCLWNSTAISKLILESFRFLGWSNLAVEFLKLSPDIIWVVSHTAMQIGIRWLALIFLWTIQINYFILIQTQQILVICLVHITKTWIPIRKIRNPTFPKYLSPIKRDQVTQVCIETSFSRLKRRLREK